LLRRALPFIGTDLTQSSPVGVHLIQTATSYSSRS